MKITGIPILFFSRSVNLGDFVEEFAPSAVDRIFTEGTDVRALVSHDPLRVLGRVSAGTLKLTKDARGLHAEIDLPATSYADDLVEARRRGDAPGWSFAFRTRRDAWVLEGDLPVRTVLDAEIIEVSAGVVWPAYPQTETAGIGWPLVAAHGAQCDDNRDAARGVARELRRLAAESGDCRVHLVADYRTNPPAITVTRSRASVSVASPARPAEPPRATERVNWSFWSTPESSWP